MKLEAFAFCMMTAIAVLFLSAYGYETHQNQILQDELEVSNERVETCFVKLKEAVDNPDLDTAILKEASKVKNDLGNFFQQLGEELKK